MDESTMKRMEQKQMRELDADYGLSLAEEYHKEKLSCSLIDIINYVYGKASRGVARVVVKEHFLRDVIDPLVFGNNNQSDTEMQRELENYNYDEFR
jgi:hypothetical protein